MESRRSFIRSMAGLTAGVMLPVGWNCMGQSPARDSFGELLPLRKLGKTGEKVTMLGIGGFHIGFTTEKDAREVIETAMEGGIRFFDTAHGYQQGLSEERYGKFLTPKYRDSVFLMTKTLANDSETLLKQVDLSLKRLNTDRVDLLQIHSVRTPEDVDDREENGVLEAMVRIQEEGKARHIGFTCHRNPYAALRMMGKLDDYPAFATVQFPLSIIDYASEHSFVREVLPVAMDRGLGVLAMKTLAAGRFFSRTIVGGDTKWETSSPAIPDHISVKEALFFSWSLPSSVLITGAENREYLLEKIGLARSFAEMKEDEKERLLDRASNVEDREGIEFYKQVDS